MSERTAETTVIEVSDLHAYYGESHALHGVTFSVSEGEILTLVGRNGAGKTTTLKSLMGMVATRTGSVRYRGQETIRLSADAIARLGLAICPEERGIFASLTVHENLLLPPKIASGGMALAEIYAMFPNILERSKSPGTKLSGGEQQMLAIARILRTGARVLLLDEPTEGLAPVIVDQIVACVRQLKKLGFTIVLVEQNFKVACKVSDTLVVIENGRAVDRFEAHDFDRQTQKLVGYLGL